MRPLFPVEAGVERCIGDVDGEVVWIELFAKPLDLFGAFRVGGIGKDLEQFFIAPGAAAILWWTVALPGDAGWI